jgi:chromosome segregation ATPase
MAYNEFKFSETETGKLLKRIEELNEITIAHNESVRETLELFAQKEKDIEAEYGAIGLLADKYFELADQETLTAEQQALLKTYAQELIDKIPELSGLIDEQTGAYKGTKEEIQELITKTKEYYLVQAAQEKLIELAKKQYETERILKERQEERKNMTEQLRKEQDKLDKLVNGQSIPIQYQSGKAQTEHYKAVAETERAIKDLEKEITDYDKKTQETISTQKEINKEWEYAETYISNYSTQVEKDMEKVKSSVGSALTDVETKVRSFRLPPLQIKMELDDSAVRNYAFNNPGVPVARAYATGGYPEMGQLFVAREAGPELVGNIGNKTAVASNDQIVQAVSQGVAMAVASVMGSSGGKAQVIENIINLDGDILYRAFNKAKQSSDMRFNPVMQGG